TITLPLKPYAGPPPAPANNYTDRCSQVRNFGEHSRGFSMSAVRVSNYTCSYYIWIPNDGTLR
ncbi:hypothetical protein, partial [Mycolicibacterium grossiae]|uniref:hypothetical protein n=1 Tax=Mycolicibacterium grossiae TaxID=1552759 RepID=UPI001C4081BB